MIAIFKREIMNYLKRPLFWVAKENRYVRTTSRLFPYRCLPASRRKVFLGRYQR